MNYLNIVTKYHLNVKCFKLYSQLSHSILLDIMNALQPLVHLTHSSRKTKLLVEKKNVFLKI